MNRHVQHTVLVKRNVYILKRILNILHYIYYVVYPYNLYNLHRNGRRQRHTKPENIRHNSNLLQQEIEILANTLNSLS